MVFEDNDEFGIQQFRDDASYVFNANSTTVKLIRHNESKSQYVQGDFMGIKTKTFKDDEVLIDINIMSQNPESDQLDREGYDGKGVIEYEGYCSYDVDVDNKDIIEFVSNYGYNIKAGQKFKIEMQDAGLFQGQYCYKNFKLIKI